MHTPTLQAFQELAKSGDTIPVYREFHADLLTPVGAFLGLQHGLTALLWTIVLGGVTGLAMLIWQIGAGRILVGTARHLALVVRSRGWVPLETAEREPLKRSLFLAPSALAGVLMTLTGAAESLREYI